MIGLDRISFTDIIWAASVFKDEFINAAYLGVLRNRAFLERLRYSPQSLDVTDVRHILVQFLNDWGCRLKNYDNVTAANLKNCILRYHHDLFAIQNYSTLDFDFEDETNKRKIENIFDGFWDSRIARNFGPTAISKTLHIINPYFFGMWDNDIRTIYWVHNRDISDSGAGYFFFLIEIKKIAERLVNEFQQKFNTADPTIWISKRLAINPPLSLIKFIDEFNWLSFRKGRKRPSDWIPSFSLK